MPEKNSKHLLQRPRDHVTNEEVLHRNLSTTLELDNPLVVRYEVPGTCSSAYQTITALPLSASLDAVGRQP